MRKTAVIIFIGFSFATLGQSFTGTGGAIPNDEQVMDYPITVSGLTAVLDTISFGLEAVCFDLSHHDIGELEIQVVAPDGSTALLSSGAGSGTGTFSNTCFEQNGSPALLSGTSPYNGTFEPQGRMGLVNNGQNGNGTWKIRVKDLYSGNEPWGALNGSSLRFGNAPAGYVNLTSSNLPIVIINTGGQPVPTDPRIEGTLRITDPLTDGTYSINGPFSAYNSFCGIEIKGSASVVYPKKNYSVEFWNAFNEDQEAPVFGMPQESDWVLDGNYIERSGLNNALAFDLGRRLGHYAPRWQHVEVVLNGAYVGVYTFMEQIKRDADRVDISNLTAEDLNGDSLTGGYILELVGSAPNPANGWTSTIPPNNSAISDEVHIKVEYPRDPLPEQTAYIKAYVDSFEVALAGPEFEDPLLGFRRYVDERSIIDHFLVTEFSKSIASYRTNAYFYKAKITREGKLFMGPLWDLDLGFGNASECAGNDPQGWQYEYNAFCDNGARVPFWWERFLEDPAFVRELSCRWVEVRNTVFDPSRLTSWCDSMEVLLTPAMTRNFTVWPTLGADLPPSPGPSPDSFSGEVEELQQWINARWSWMDENLSGGCAVGMEERKEEGMMVWPNPGHGTFHVRAPGHQQGHLSHEVTDQLGRTITTRLTRNGNGQYTIQFADQPPPGAYVLRLVSEGVISTAHILCSEGLAPE